MEPKPELEAAYAHIKRESNRQGTMSEVGVTSEATALATARSRQSRPNNYSVDLTRNRLPMKCTRCGLDNHTIKGCYEIIGYPEGWVHKGRKKDSTRASFASAQSSEETASEPPSGTSGSKALATSGTFCTSSLTCNRSWIIDTGATDHMTSSFTGLHSTKPSSQTHITSANGTTSQVMGEWSLSLPSSLSLDHVLVVPSLDYDLLSVPQIIDSLNCTHEAFWELTGFGVVGTPKLSELEAGAIPGWVTPREVAPATLPWGASAPTRTSDPLRGVDCEIPHRPNGEGVMCLICAHSHLPSMRPSGSSLGGQYRATVEPVRGVTIWYQSHSAVGCECADEDVGSLKGGGLNSKVKRVGGWSNPRMGDPLGSCSVSSQKQIRAGLGPKRTISCYGRAGPGRDTVIGCGTRRGKLYYLDLIEDISTRLSQTHHVKGDESIRMKKIWLWHRRLGHASFGYLKLLFPDLFSQFAESDFHCETCILAKSHRISYPLRLNKSSLPFMIVHSDVWGPSRVPTISGFKWFMTFIDDCTRMTWVFPLKQKSEVTAKFKLFYQYVATQFDKKITTLRSDNGGEYVNHDLHTFLSQHGIVHQTTCAYTPHNRMASQSNTIQHSSVSNSISDIDHSPPHAIHTNLEPRLFGCVAYVQVYPHQRGKLDPCALRCVFVGYAATQKGYKCFHPPTQTMHVTADVTFHESEFYYSGGVSEHPLQGESSIFAEDTQSIQIQQTVLEQSVSEQPATVVQQDQELLETPDDGSDNFPPTTVPSPIIQSGPEDSPQVTEHLNSNLSILHESSHTGNTVNMSSADTFRIPLASISKQMLNLGTPLGAGGISLSLKSPKQ
ncbi:hypothetical protein L3X38_014273 [Prunus dulcis]|uniref:Integrase catalytic domain-containing protein n=1 Tax=Prunus dulcis TaxID=3755 RepID=A0AAD4WN24_PRUDU|nr:hypothetical protein L3X38_014273 [Prunus dulcis]